MLLWTSSYPGIICMYVSIKAIKILCCHMITCHASSKHKAFRTLFLSTATRLCWHPHWPYFSWSSFNLLCTLLYYCNKILQMLKMLKQALPLHLIWLCIRIPYGKKLWRRCYCKTLAKKLWRIDAKKIIWFNNYLITLYTFRGKLVSFLKHYGSIDVLVISS